MSAPPSRAPIRVDGLSKVYRPARRTLFSRRRRGEERPALAGLCFEVPAGQALGVIGRNGSGKSTLLRILAGALPPSAGVVQVQGRIASLLDLTSGINPEFSGEENALVLGMLAGHTRAELQERMGAIQAFSGLGEAFGDPVKSYSAGMTLRLGFSAAVHTDPDVLLIDEALAVGDAFFQQRCLRRMREFRELGKTIVLVSHDPSAILSLCDRALWLEGGTAAALGEPEEVVRRYLAARYRDDCAIDSPLVASGRPPEASSSLSTADPLPAESERFGDGRARILGVSLRDTNDQRIDSVRAGDHLQVVVSARAEDEIRSPLIGFTLRNRLGDVTTATNTEHAGFRLDALRAGEEITVAFDIVWPPLAAGTFALSPAIADGAVDGHTMCDWAENALVVHAHNPRALFGWLSLEDVHVRASRGRGRPEDEGDGGSDPSGGSEPEPEAAAVRLLGAVDHPREDVLPPSELGEGGRIYVSGWAFASDGSTLHVDVRIGEAEPVRAVWGSFRDDVGAFHPGTPWAGRSGFGALVPGPGPGPAMLRVEVACEEPGDVRAVLAERRIEIPDAGAAPARPLARPRRPGRRAAGQPPHLLWASHRLELEGAPRSLLELGARLRSRYRTSVISPADGPLRKDWEAMEVPVRIQAVEIHASVDDYEATIRRLAALCSADPPDLVVANTLDAFWAVDLARELGVPSVWIVRESEPPHGYFLDRWPRPMADRIAHCFESCDRLLFVAKATEQLFCDVKDPAHRPVIRNGIDHERIAPLLERSRDAWCNELGLDTRRSTLLCVGTPCQRKGQLVLLRALARLREREDAPLCLFLGVREGEYLDLMRATIESEGLEDAVELRPPTNEPLGYYGASDLLVCPSFQESLPRVVMEAAAFGLPIVASEVDGVPELVRNGREALLVRPGDAASLATAIARLLDEPALATALGRAAQRRSRAEFSLTASADRYDALFQELLEPGSESR